jgi:predicted alpha/beta superfamily hydrolase
MRMPHLLVSTAIFSAAASSATAQDAIPFGQTYTIESEALGETRTINVWIPAFADQDERAPYRTLYLIDGGTLQDWFHITGLAQLGALSWTFQPMIVVGIETDDRQAELTPAAADQRYTDGFPTSGQAENFRGFITSEVKPFVETNFPVSGDTSIIGESLAGLFIIDTFLKMPDAFDDYIAISPSLWWDDKAQAIEASERLEAGDYDGKRLYLAHANEGGTMQAAIDIFRSAASTAGIDLTYEDMSETQTHSTIFHQAALNAFRVLYAEPPYDYGAPAWYMHEGGVPESSSD